MKEVQRNVVGAKRIPRKNERKQKVEVRIDLQFSVQVDDISEINNSVKLSIKEAIENDLQMRGIPTHGEIYLVIREVGDE